MYVVITNFDIANFIRISVFKVSLDNHNFLVRDTFKSKLVIFCLFIVSDTFCSFTYVRYRTAIFEITTLGQGKSILFYVYYHINPNSPIRTQMAIPFLAVFFTVKSVTSKYIVFFFFDIIAHHTHLASSSKIEGTVHEGSRFVGDGGHDGVDSVCGVRGTWSGDSFRLR